MDEKALQKKLEEGYHICWFTDRRHRGDWKRAESLLREVKVQRVEFKNADVVAISCEV